MIKKIKKCKNCNDIFSGGSSDRIYCNEKCRSNYFYKSKTLKDINNKDKDMLKEVLAHLSYLKLNTYGVIQVKNTNKGSTDDLELQMESLKRNDLLSRIWKIESFILLNTKSRLTKK